MALDFPASPVNGQVFAASNGVNYQYVTPPGYWQAISAVPPVQITGDFWAYISANIGPLGAATVQLIPNVVGSGNAGSWYSTSTGRWTPPAGRYFLYTTVVAASSAGALQYIINLRKNGVNIPGVVSWETPSNVSYYSTAKMGFNVDASGTDFFDLTISPNAGSTNVIGVSFGAFPLGGMIGPKGVQGDPGTFGTGFRLLARTTLAIAAADISYQAVPADINDLMFSFDVLPSVNDQTLQFQFYDTAGTLDNVSGHYACGYFQCWNSLANGTAPSAGGGNGFGTGAIVMSNYAATAAVGTANGIRGKGFIPNIRKAAPRSVEWSANYTDSAAALNRQVNGSGWRNIAGSITGFRLVFGNGLAAGSVLSTWGSP